MSTLSSGSSSRRPRYSIKWADSVVKLLYEKYPRGCTFWEQLSGISKPQMGMILARNTGEWHLIRSLIAKFDFQYQLRDSQPWKEREMVAVLGNLLYECIDKAKEAKKQTFAQFLEDLTYRVPEAYSKGAG